YRAAPDCLVPDVTLVRDQPLDAPHPAPPFCPWTILKWRSSEISRNLTFDPRRHGGRSTRGLATPSRAGTGVAPYDVYRGKCQDRARLPEADRYARAAAGYCHPYTGQ